MKVKGESVLSKKKTNPLPTSKILKPKIFKSTLKQTNSLKKEKLQLASINEDLTVRNVVKPEKGGKVLKSNVESGSIPKNKHNSKLDTKAGDKKQNEPFNKHKTYKKGHNSSNNLSSKTFSSIKGSPSKKKTKPGTTKKREQSTTVIGQKKNKTYQPSEEETSKSVLNLNKVKDAVTGLLKISKTSSESSKLLDLDQSVFLQVECIKIPICPKKQLRFNLPHPLINELSDILLITADKKGSKINPEKAVEHYSELLEKHKINFIQKVMPVRSLREEYSQYEMRRKLVDQYDMILGDAKIIKLLPSLLGKLVCFTRKMPIPVQLDRANLKQHLQAALRKTQMSIKPTGHMSVVQVGHTGMSAEHIAANVTAVAQTLAAVYPGGWINVRSLKIKTNKSQALPVYLSLRSSNEVRIPVELRKRPPPVEGELSTMPGTNVIVRGDGTVILKKVPEEKLIDDSHDAEILEEAQKYLQSSKTIRYDDSDEASDKEADAITEAVEQRFMASYRTSKANQGEESGDEQEEEEEESDEEEAEVQLPILGKKRKKGDDKSKSPGKSPNKKLKSSQPGQKADGKKAKPGKGTPSQGNKENQRRGSRGGKKNKMNKDQRKAMIKRNKAGKK